MTLGESRRRLALLIAIGLVFVAAESAHADITVGTFNIGGSVTFTPNAITWKNSISPFTADEANIGPTPTGIYSALSGTTVTISDLNFGIEPVGLSFSAQPFISFDAAPFLSALHINYIFQGIYTAAGCSANPPAAGQTCTPTGSPLSLVNNGPANNITSTAVWVVSGVSADGTYTWNGMFTSVFPDPFQTELAGFLPGGPGSITNTYSATITVNQPTNAPEPSSLLLLGSGLAGVAGLARRKLKR